MLPRKLQVETDAIAGLIQMDKGMSADEVDKVLAILSEPLFGSLYSYYYVSDTKAFRHRAPLVAQEGRQVSLQEIEYAEQEFTKFVKMLEKSHLSPTMAVDDFVDYLQKLFADKVDVNPIINYFQHKEMIDVGADEITLLG